MTGKPISEGRRALLKTVGLGVGALAVSYLGGHGVVTLTDTALRHWTISQAQALIIPDLFGQTKNEPKLKEIILQMLDFPLDPKLLSEAIGWIKNIKEAPDNKYVRLMIAVVLLKTIANRGFGKVDAEKADQLLRRFIGNHPIPIKLSSPEEASSAVVFAEILGRKVIVQLMFNLEQLAWGRYFIEGSLFHELTHIFDSQFLGVKENEIAPKEVSAWSTEVAYAFKIMGEKNDDYLPHRHYDLSFGCLFFKELLEYYQSQKAQEKLHLTHLFKASRIVLPANSSNISNCGNQWMTAFFSQAKLNPAMDISELIRAISREIHHQGQEPSLTTIMLAKHNFRELGLSFKNRSPEFFLRRYLAYTFLEYSAYARKEPMTVYHYYRLRVELVAGQLIPWLE
ncbi:MAG: hypothetical protein ABIH50_07070 [bacterium]